MTAGEEIARREVVLQAEANGWTEQEAHSMLDGYGDRLVIPEQRSLFGDMWPGNQANDLITPPDGTVDSYRQWLDRKRKQNVEPKEGDDGRMYPVWHDPEHNWSHQKARQNFARAKDVDRHFWRSHDQFTTVLVTRTADENTDPLLEQTEAMTPKAYYQSRYRLLKRLSSGDYALLEVRAPKYDLPTQSERTVRTHVHTGIWLPGHHSAEDFDLLKVKHMAKVPGATDCHISVRHHSADTYPPVENGLDSDRGVTTALPYELAGENQPLMNVKTDASDLYDERCLKWCATLSAGEDGTHSTPGKGYWKELGGFGEIADEVKDNREEYSDLITQPDRTVGTNQTQPLDEPKPSPSENRQRAEQALIRAVSRLARVSTPGEKA